MYTRKPCCGRKTTLCHCKIRHVLKFTAVSCGSPCFFVYSDVCCKYSVNTVAHTWKHDLDLTLFWQVSNKVQRMRLPEVMQIRDFFHTKPTELSTAHCTSHVIARAVVHFDDESTTVWTRLDFIYIINAFYIDTNILFHQCNYVLYSLHLWFYSSHATSLT